MKRAALFLCLAALALAGAAGAQPDKGQVLAKAKAKFEQDTLKAEDSLIAAVDKALTKALASGNKAAAEKLTYERDLFLTKRMLPTQVPTATYLKQRAQAVAALEAAYLPALKELTKAKKEDDVAALETALGDLLKAARGYGLGVPELSSRPALVIENKATGLVMEASGKDDTGDVVLAKKVGRQRPAQCWHLDRDEKGYSIVNALTGRACFINNREVVGNEKAVTHLASNKLDPQKEVPDRFLFQLSETRRDVLIVSQQKGEEVGRVFTAGQRKQKGVVTDEPVLEKPEAPPGPSQLWTITVAK